MLPSNERVIEHLPAERAEVLNPMTMIDRALELNAAPETLEKLLALQERWEANQARKAFDEAMAAAKAEIPIIRKNRTVDFTSNRGRTHYRYEDLAEIAETVNPILGKHGLSYRYRTSAGLNEPITVTCIVTHRMGYFEETTLPGPRDETGNKNAIQQVASTLTYLQRMTLKAALGLAAAEDDDGANAGKVQEPISDDQLTELRRIIADTGADEARFCRYYKIEQIADLPSKRFDEARAALWSAAEERKKKAQADG